MRAVVQRVKEARVTVDGEVVGRIGRGLLVLLGVGVGDGDAEAEAMAEKVANLRIFADEKGQMNLSVLDVAGEALVVSQFTLLGDVRRGRRPSYIDAAPARRGQPALRALRGGGAPARSPGRDRRLPGHDGRGARERRAGDDPSRQQEDVLRPPSVARPLTP